MRHRRKGRVLGRSPSHQRALLRSLATALLLTERDAEFDDNTPKVKGRIITTISKAKEVRPLVEKCVTIARRSLSAEQAAREHGTSADRGSQEWKTWRESDNWRAWNEAISPALAARRRCLQLLHNKEAVAILFDEVGPRFEDRPGGYTRIIRLAKPRLGDGGTRAILEFVGVRDRVVERSEKPAFDDADDAPTDDAPADEQETSETTADEAAADDSEAAAADETQEKDAK